MIKFVLASATLAIFAAPAFAQVTPQPTTSTPPAAEDKFIKHDKDGDGALSVAEVKAADAKVTQADFDKYDGVSSIGQRNTYLDSRTWSDDDEASISQDEGFSG